jgi:RNA polymerase sigma factor (sigma-70 family)
VAQCARYVGAADAEEAAQDALLRALAALRRGDQVGRPAPWLHVIARHVALNLRRARAARGECALPESIDAGSDGGLPAATRDRLNDVVAAVESLPPRQREAIVMRELEGRSYVEIAERLHSTPGAVRQLLHRARASVRQRAAGLLPWEPLMRWVSSSGWAGSGSRVGALADSCLATAKVCAALVPAAVLGAGGVTALDRGLRTGTAVRAHTTAATTTTTHAAPRHHAAHRRTAAVTLVSHSGGSRSPATPAPRFTRTNAAATRTAAAHFVALPQAGRSTTTTGAHQTSPTAAPSHPSRRCPSRTTTQPRETTREPSTQTGRQDSQPPAPRQQQSPQRPQPQQREQLASAPASSPPQSPRPLPGG